MTAHWIDRITGQIAPRWTLNRQRARVASDLLTRHYDAASVSRRTQGWRKTAGDVNAVIGPQSGRLRDVARDLVRNNPHAEAALTTIVDHTVGYGIVAQSQPKSARAMKLWRQWANTTACDADGRHDFAGLQKLVLRGVAESGEVLVRRRLRRPEDGLPIGLQLQVLEADFLDSTKDFPPDTNGVRTIHGVEFDPLGRRTAYWLFRDHPGTHQVPGLQSVRVPAEGVLHIFRALRPGQVRGVTWFAPTLLRFKDFDEFEDATLMKQKIAACLALIMTDVDGTQSSIGVADDTQVPGLDMLGPGLIMNAPLGRDVKVVEPPSASDYEPYSRNLLRSIATGLGITYEDITGDYSNVNFSSARMARLNHYDHVYDWRWRVLIPQFCDPVWRWSMSVAAVGQNGEMGPSEDLLAEWTAPPIPMIEPDKEGLAYQRLLRIGAITWPEMVRERGYDPEAQLATIAEWNQKFDDLEVILDGDARKTTAQGLAQQRVIGEDDDAPAVMSPKGVHTK